METPTPYDISPIPVFAPVPSAVWWITLISVFLLSLIPLMRRSSAPVDPSRPALEQALKDIQRLFISTASPKEILSELAVILRRILHVLRVIDSPALTTTEIERRASGAPGALKELALALAALERERFSPHISSEIPQRYLETSKAGLLKLSRELVVKT